MGPFDFTTQVLAEAALADASKLDRTLEVVGDSITASCEWLAKQSETLTRIHDLYQFVRKAEEGFALAASASLAGLAPIDLAKQAASFILARCSVHVDLADLQPSDRTLHYLHPDTPQLHASYVLGRIRATAEPTWADRFLGCAEAVGIDLPRSGPLANLPVTLDTTHLRDYVRFETMYSIGYQPWKTAPAGEPGTWEAMTDVKGEVAFSLTMIKQESLPSGRGDIASAELPFRVYAYPDKLDNLVAAALRLADIDQVHTDSSLVVQWHSQSAP